MRIIPSSTSSEHWLTLMTCTRCSNTPDDSPVYKCTLGHTICFNCFQNLVTTGGIPTCGICESDKFTRQDVSADFLRKLKTKPGIGRPRRYSIENSSSIMERTDMDDTVTVEKLFQLPSSKIQQLFDENTKEKLRYLNSCSKHNTDTSKIYLKNEKRDEIVSPVPTIDDRYSNLWSRKTASRAASSMTLSMDTLSNYLVSRKPLKCPHDPCNKIIAVSSFQSHFKYEHCDFDRYNLERGKEIRLSLDPIIIQRNKTFCLAILKLYDNPREEYSHTNIGKIAKKFTKKMEVDTFWVMVSGSTDDRVNRAYVVFWLFTNNDELYNCTLELSSKNDVVTATSLCSVNGIHESQNLSEISSKLECLYLTQSAIKSMLAFGHTLKLRIKIH